MMFFEVYRKGIVDFFKYEPVITFLLKEGQTFKEMFYFMS
jgi:hypothetical protein